MVTYKSVHISRKGVPWNPQIISLRNDVKWENVLLLEQKQQLDKVRVKPMQPQQQSAKLEEEACKRGRIYTDWY